MQENINLQDNTQQTNDPIPFRKKLYKDVQNEYKISGYDIGISEQEFYDKLKDNKNKQKLYDILEDKYKRENKKFEDQKTFFDKIDTEFGYSKNKSGEFLKPPTENKKDVGLFDIPKTPDFKKEKEVENKNIDEFISLNENLISSANTLNQYNKLSNDYNEIAKTINEQINLLDKSDPDYNNKKSQIISDNKESVQGLQNIKSEIEKLGLTEQKIYEIRNSKELYNEKLKQISNYKLTPEQLKKLGIPFDNGSKLNKISLLSNVPTNIVNDNIPTSKSVRDKLPTNQQERFNKWKEQTQKNTDLAINNYVKNKALIDKLNETQVNNLLQQTKQSVSQGKLVPIQENGQYDLVKSSNYLDASKKVLLNATIGTVIHFNTLFTGALSKLIGNTKILENQLKIQEDFNKNLENKFGVSKGAVGAFEQMADLVSLAIPIGAYTKGAAEIGGATKFGKALKTTKKGTEKFNKIASTIGGTTTFSIDRFANTLENNYQQLINDEALVYGGIEKIPEDRKEDVIKKASNDAFISAVAGAPVDIAFFAFHTKEYNNFLKTLSLSVAKASTLGGIQGAALAGLSNIEGGYENKDVLNSFAQSAKDFALIDLGFKISSGILKTGSKVIDNAAKIYMSKVNPKIIESLLKNYNTEMVKNLVETQEVIEDVQQGTNDLVQQVTDNFNKNYLDTKQTEDKLKDIPEEKRTSNVIGIQVGIDNLDKELELNYKAISEIEKQTQEKLKNAPEISKSFIVEDANGAIENINKKIESLSLAKKKAIERQKKYLDLNEDEVIENDLETERKSTEKNTEEAGKQAEKQEIESGLVTEPTDNVGDIITIEPKKNEQFEPPKFEPPKFEPPKIEPPKFEPPKIEPPKFEPPKIEPPKIEPPKIEPPKIEPPKFEPPKIEPPKFEPPKFEPPKFEPPKIEPPKIEQTEPVKNNSENDVEVELSEEEKERLENAKSKRKKQQYNKKEYIDKNGEIKYSIEDERQNDLNDIYDIVGGKKITESKFETIKKSLGVENITFEEYNEYQEKQEKIKIDEENYKKESEQDNTTISELVNVINENSNGDLKIVVGEVKNKRIGAVAFFDPKTNTITISSKLDPKTKLSKIGHEVTHFLEAFIENVAKTRNNEIAKAILKKRDMVLKELEEYIGKNLTTKEGLERVRKELGISDKYKGIDLINEIFPKLIERELNKNDTEAKGIFKKMKDIVKDYVQKIKDFIFGLKGFSDIKSVEDLMSLTSQDFIKRFSEETLSGGKNIKDLIKAENDKKKNAENQTLKKLRDEFKDNPRILELFGDKYTHEAWKADDVVDIYNGFLKKSLLGDNIDFIKFRNIIDSLEKTPFEDAKGGFLLGFVKELADHIAKLDKPDVTLENLLKNSTKELKIISNRAGKSLYSFSLFEKLYHLTWGTNENNTELLKRLFNVNTKKQEGIAKESISQVQKLLGVETEESSLLNNEEVKKKDELIQKLRNEIKDLSLEFLKKVKSHYKNIPDEILEEIAENYSNKIKYSLEDLILDVEKKTNIKVDRKKIYNEVKEAKSKKEILDSKLERLKKENEQLKNGILKANKSKKEIKLTEEEQKIQDEIDDLKQTNYLLKRSIQIKKQIDELRKGNLPDKVERIKDLTDEQQEIQDQINEAKQTRSLLTRRIKINEQIDELRKGNLPDKVERIKDLTDEQQEIQDQINEAKQTRSLLTRRIKINEQIDELRKGNLPDKVERIKDLTDEQQEIQDQINEAKQTRSLLTRRIKINEQIDELRKGNLPDKVERIKDLTDEQQEIQDQINEAKQTRSLLTRRIKINEQIDELRKGNLPDKVERIKDLTDEQQEIQDEINQAKQTRSLLTRRIKINEQIDELRKGNLPDKVERIKDLTDEQQEIQDEINQAKQTRSLLTRRIKINEQIDELRKGNLPDKVERIKDLTDEQQEIQDEINQAKQTRSLLTRRIKINEQIDELRKGNLPDKVERIKDLTDEQQEIQDEINQAKQTRSLLTRRIKINEQIDELRKGNLPDKVERIKDLTDEQQEIQDQINEAKKTRSLLTQKIRLEEKERDIDNNIESPKKEKSELTDEQKELLNQNNIKKRTINLKEKLNKLKKENEDLVNGDYVEKETKKDSEDVELTDEQKNINEDLDEEEIRNLALKVLRKDEIDKAENAINILEKGGAKFTEKQRKKLISELFKIIINSKNGNKQTDIDLLNALNKSLGTNRQVITLEQTNRIREINEKIEVSRKYIQEDLLNNLVKKIGNENLTEKEIESLVKDTEKLVKDEIKNVFKLIEEKENIFNKNISFSDFILTLANSSILSTRTIVGNYLEVSSNAVQKNIINVIQNLFKKDKISFSYRKKLFDRVYQFNNILQFLESIKEVESLGDKYVNSIAKIAKNNLELDKSGVYKLGLKDKFINNILSLGILKNGKSLPVFGGYIDLISRGIQGGEKIAVSDAQSRFFLKTISNLGVEKYLKDNSFDIIALKFAFDFKNSYSDLVDYILKNKEDNKKAIELLGLNENNKEKVLKTLINGSIDYIKKETYRNENVITKFLVQQKNSKNYFYKTINLALNLGFKFAKVLSNVADKGLQVNSVLYALSRYYSLNYKISKERLKETNQPLYYLKKQELNSVRNYAIFGSIVRLAGAGLVMGGLAGYDEEQDKVYLNIGDKKSSPIKYEFAMWALQTGIFTQTYVNKDKVDGQTPLMTAISELRVLIPELNFSSIGDKSTLKQIETMAGSSIAADFLKQTKQAVKETYNKFNEVTGVLEKNKIDISGEQKENIFNNIATEVLFNVFLNPTINYAGGSSIKTFTTDYGADAKTQIEKLKKSFNVKNIFNLPRKEKTFKSESENELKNAEMYVFGDKNINFINKISNKLVVKDFLGKIVYFEKIKKTPNFLYNNLIYQGKYKTDNGNNIVFSKEQKNEVDRKFEENLSIMINAVEKNINFVGLNPNNDYEEYNIDDFLEDNKDIISKVRKIEKNSENITPKEFENLVSKIRNKAKTFTENWVKHKYRGKIKEEEKNK